MVVNEELWRSWDEYFQKTKPLSYQSLSICVDNFIKLHQALYSNDEIKTLRLRIKEIFPAFD